MGCGGEKINDLNGGGRGKVREGKGKCDRVTFRSQSFFSYGGKCGGAGKKLFRGEGEEKFGSLSERHKSRA